MSGKKWINSFGEKETSKERRVRRKVSKARKTAVQAVQIQETIEVVFSEGTFQVPLRRG